MASWYDRLISALGREPGAVANVHELMCEAHRARARIELVPQSLTSGASDTLATTIELVEDEDIIVSQPVRGGSTRPIGRFEQYRITVPTAYGSAHGETRCVGRQQIQSGSDATLYGYRMKIPTTMKAVERSPLARIMGEDTVREAQLLILGREGHIHGLVQRLDSAGATLICRNADKIIQPRRRAAFKLELPAPIGRIEETITITDTAPDPKSGSVIVDVRFDRKIKSIEEAMRTGRRRTH